MCVLNRLRSLKYILRKVYNNNSFLDFARRSEKKHSVPRFSRSVQIYHHIIITFKVISIHTYTQIRLIQEKKNREKRRNFYEKQQQQHTHTR